MPGRRIIPRGLKTAYGKAPSQARKGLGTAMRNSTKKRTPSLRTGPTSPDLNYKMGRKR